MNDLDSLQTLFQDDIITPATSKGKLSSPPTSKSAQQPPASYNMAFMAPAAQLKKAPSISTRKPLIFAAMEAVKSEPELKLSASYPSPPAEDGDLFTLPVKKRMSTISPAPRTNPTYEQLRMPPSDETPDSRPFINGTSVGYTINEPVASSPQFSPATIPMNGNSRQEGMDPSHEKFTSPPSGAQRSLPPGAAPPAPMASRRMSFTPQELAKPLPIPVDYPPPVDPRRRMSTVPHEARSLPTDHRQLPSINVSRRIMTTQMDRQQHRRKPSPEQQKRTSVLDPPFTSHLRHSPHMDSRAITPESRTGTDSTLNHTQTVLPARSASVNGRLATPDRPSSSHRLSMASLLTGRSTPQKSRPEDNSPRASPNPHSHHQKLHKARPTTPISPGTPASGRRPLPPSTPEPAIVGVDLDDDPFARPEGVKLLGPSSRDNSKETVNGGESSSSEREEDKALKPTTPHSPPVTLPKQVPPTPVTPVRRRDQRLDKSDLPPNISAIPLRPDRRSEPFPLDLFVAEPLLLSNLLAYLSFYDWCLLSTLCKTIRKTLLEEEILKEEILERFLKTVGYKRWNGDDGKDPLALTIMVRVPFLSKHYLNLIISIGPTRLHAWSDSSYT